MAEKTEKPTAKKLRDAREEGQVAKTPAIGKALALAAVFELVLGTRHLWREAFLHWIDRAMDRAARADGSAPYYLQAQLSLPIFHDALMFSVAAVGCAAVIDILASFAQVGVQAAPAGLIQAEALNPVSNVKNMFSMQQVVTLLLNIFKVTAVGICVWFAVRSSFEPMLLAAGGTMESVWEVFVGVVAHAERMAIVLLVAFSVMDYVVARKQFIKGQMMSKEDIEQERKEMFGSKEVRQHRKRFSREVLQGDAPQRQVKRANALVTNPEHFAVALRYAPQECPLPVVLARGADEVAHAMVAEGRALGVPVIRSVWLARTLYAVGREDEVVPRVALVATAAVYKAIVRVLEEGGAFDKVIELEGDAARAPHG